jgi:tetratricopeptide (TPR) repeat protein
MWERILITTVLIAACAAFGSAKANYLDENPDEVFADVFPRLGIKLSNRIAHDPFVWLRLEELKREPCDQKSVGDLALFLEKQGYRREAGESLYNFVRNCGAPINALHQSADIFLKLSDYSKATEVADEFIRRAPLNHDAHYLRGVALEGAGDYKRAVADYADAIELFAADKKQISSTVFLRMANAYAALRQFCEAASPIYA